MLISDLSLSVQADRVCLSPSRKPEETDKRQLRYPVLWVNTRRVVSLDSLRIYKSTIFSKLDDGQTDKSEICFITDI